MGASYHVPGSPMMEAMTSELSVQTIALEDAAATERAGAALARLVKGGDVVAMIGDLGAGKTTLVDACVRALGGDGAHSPTFALVHEYPCRGLTVWHLDLYRIEREAELVELGLEEILGSRAGVAFVEWADKHEVLPRSYLHLTLRHREGPGRALEISSAGARGAALAAELAAALGQR